METKTYKNWWFLALNGLISILIGIVLMFFAKEVINQIVFFIGVVLLAIGIIFFISAIYHFKKDKGAVLVMFESIASIVIGICIMIFPKNSVQVFMILIGVWTIILGVFQLAVLINVRKVHSAKNVILFNGLLTIALGIVFIFDPFTLFAAVAWVIRILGGLAALFGLVMIYIAFSVRNIKPAETNKPAENTPSTGT